MTRKFTRTLFLFVFAFTVTRLLDRRFTESNFLTPPIDFHRTLPPYWQWNGFNFNFVGPSLVLIYWVWIKCPLKNSLQEYIVNLVYDETLWIDRGLWLCVYWILLATKPKLIRYIVIWSYFDILCMKFKFTLVCGVLSLIKMFVHKVQGAVSL